MIERDFYFASWVIEKGIPYELKNRQVHLLIDSDTHFKLKKEYQKTDRSRFERVRKILSSLKSRK